MHDFSQWVSLWKAYEPNVLAPEWSWASNETLLMMGAFLFGSFFLLIAIGFVEDLDGDGHVGWCVKAFAVAWCLLFCVTLVSYVFSSITMEHADPPSSFTAQVESSFNVSSFSCNGCDADPKTSPLPNGVDASWMSDGRAYRGMVMSEGTKVGLYVTQGDGGLVPFDRTGVDG